MEYRTKWIISGNHIEVYKNDVGIKIGKRKYKKKRKIKTGKDEVVVKKPEKLSEFAVYRCRRKIKWLINSNPDMNKFLTLTFAENVTDLQLCNEKFKAYIRKLKILYPNFKYLVVPEFQKRGAVHYHIVLNIDYTHHHVLEDLWGHGFIKIKRLKKKTNIGLYMSKYIGKNLDDTRYINNKKYFTSRNLEKPMIFYSRDKNVNFLNLNKLEPVCIKPFNSYHGLIKYMLYVLDKDKK